MNGAKLRPCTRLVYGTIALFLTLVATASTLMGQNFPRYNHVFLVIMENEGYQQVIGNPYAPIMNALARNYGLATNYRRRSERA